MRIPESFSVIQVQALTQLLSMCRDIPSQRIVDLEGFLASDDLLLWQMLFKPLADVSRCSVLAKLLLLAGRPGIEKLHSTTEGPFFKKAVQELVQAQCWTQTAIILETLDQADVLDILTSTPFALSNEAIAWMHQAGFLQPVLEPWATAADNSVLRLRRWQELESGTLAEDSLLLCLSVQPNITLHSLATPGRSFLQLCLQNNFDRILNLQQSTLTANPALLNTLLTQSLDQGDETQALYLYGIGARVAAEQFPPHYLATATQANDTPLLQYLLDNTPPQELSLELLQPILCKALEYGQCKAAETLLNNDCDANADAQFYQQAIRSACCEESGAALALLLNERGERLPLDQLPEIVRNLWATMPLSTTSRLELWSLLQRICQTHDVDFWEKLQDSLAQDLLPMLAPHLIEQAEWQHMLQPLPDVFFNDKARQTACLKAAEAIQKQASNFDSSLPTTRCAEIIHSLLPSDQDLLVELLEGVGFEDPLWDYILACEHPGFLQACVQQQIPVTAESSPIARAIKRNFWSMASYICQNIGLTPSVADYALDMLLLKMQRAPLENDKQRREIQAKGPSLMNLLLPVCGNLNGLVGSTSKPALIWRFLSHEAKPAWSAHLIGLGSALDSDNSGDSLATQIIFDLIYANRVDVILKTIRDIPGFWDLQCSRHHIKIMGQIIQATARCPQLSDTQEKALLTLFIDWKSTVSKAERLQLLINPIGSEMASSWTAIAAPRLQVAILRTIENSKQ